MFFMSCYAVCCCFGCLSRCVFLMFVDVFSCFVGCHFWVLILFLSFSIVDFGCVSCCVSFDLFFLLFLCVLYNLLGCVLC